MSDPGALMRLELKLTSTDARSAAAIVARFAEWEQVIATETSETTLTDAAEQARVLRAVAAVRKMASEVGVAALRVEARALRRLYQIGCRDQEQYNGKTTMHYAARFARLSDLEFDDALTSSQPGSCAALYYAITTTAKMDAAANTVRAGGVPAINSYPGRDTTERLAAAAALVLQQASAVGDPFTTTEAAEQLLEALDIDRGPLEVTAARDLIREAIRTPQPSEKRGVYPEVITFRAAYEGAPWVRVPFGSATAEHLAWMAAYRTRQADEMRAAAESLTKLANEAHAAAEIAGVEPSEFLIADAWRKSERAA